MFTLAEGEFTVSIFVDQISFEKNSRGKGYFKDFLFELNKIFMQAGFSAQHRGEHSWRAAVWVGKLSNRASQVMTCGSRALSPSPPSTYLGPLSHFVWQNGVAFASCACPVGSPTVLDTQTLNLRGLNKARNSDVSGVSESPHGFPAGAANSFAIWGLSWSPVIYAPV